MGYHFYNVWTSSLHLYFLKFRYGPSHCISLHTRRPHAKLGNKACLQMNNFPPFFHSPSQWIQKTPTHCQLLVSLIIPLSLWPLIFACPVSSASNWLSCLLSHPLYNCCWGSQKGRRRHSLLLQNLASSRGKRTQAQGRLVSWNRKVGVEWMSLGGVWGGGGLYGICRI